MFGCDALTRRAGGGARIVDHRLTSFLLTWLILLVELGESDKQEQRQQAT
jgi:hypothetical protein